MIKRRFPRRGVALVEMVIVLPLLLLLLLGGLDLALQYHVRYCMVNACREAARTLAVRDGTQQEAENAAQGLLSGLRADFTVSFPGAESSGADVTVRISVPRDEIALGILGSAEGTIEIETTMRKEQ